MAEFTLSDGGAGGVAATIVLAGGAAATGLAGGGATATGLAGGGATATVLAGGGAAATALAGGGAESSMIWCLSGAGVASFLAAGTATDGVVCATMLDIDCVSSASLAGSIAPPWETAWLSKVASMVVRASWFAGLGVAFSGTGGGGIRVGTAGGPFATTGALMEPGTDDATTPWFEVAGCRVAEAAAWNVSGCVAGNESVGEGVA